MLQIAKTISMLLLLTLLLGGCATSNERDLMDDPEFVLQQAKLAYYDGRYKDVFQMLFPIAASGNADAQYTLGYLYYYGQGVDKDEHQAMNWIQRAAAQGHEKAIKALKK